jgi:DNA-binding NtrC family response regulator
MVCAGEEDDRDPLLVVPAAIRLPSLSNRADELPRIVDEYACDALASMRAREQCFTERDRAWVIAHVPTSLSEIEKTTLRIVALRTSSNMSNAAFRLGMASVSLSRWITHRRLHLAPAAT